MPHLYLFGRVTGLMLSAMAVTAVLVGSSAAADTPGAGYLTQDTFSLSVSELAAEFPDQCQLQVIGTSLEQRDVVVLTLSDDLNSADDSPALLLVAGLDGRHLVGTDTAVRVARRLLEQQPELLQQMTVYIVPRANPDAAQRMFGSVVSNNGRNTRPVDEDRDGAIDEDGPEDLNGDGLITMMRRLNPPLDDVATHVEDKVEPRLMKKPDAAKGERAKYSLYTEGIDNDDDGKINEDAPGGVDLDRNFMHAWPEHSSDAGMYQISEPESSAVARFVLAHRNIVSAIVYGRHDNIINVGSGKGKDVSGRTPKNLHEDDVSFYKEMKKVFEEATDQERAPKVNSDGACFAWLYAQRGLPTFATVVWGRPEVKKAEKKDEAPKEDEAAEEDEDEVVAENGEDASIDGTWSGSMSIGPRGDMDITLELERGNDDSVTGTFSARMGSGGVEGSYDPDAQIVNLTVSFGRGTGMEMTLTLEDDELTGAVTGPSGQATDISFTRSENSDDGDAKPKKKGKDKADDEEGAAWLRYSDQERDGAGFVEWQAFDHPTLGAVEIGGFAPGFRMNPPANVLDELAEKQMAFVKEVIERRPKLIVEGPEVKKLASGLYDVRFAIVNDGYFPTATAMASQARSIAPTIVRLSSKVEDIVTGARVARTWRIDGAGGRFAHHWIIRAEDGSDVTIHIRNAQLGDREIIFVAE